MEAVPPDLRVLCRLLSSTSPGDLPRLCPTLVKHVLRCGSALSASHEQRGKSGADEAGQLVGKLRTQVNSLLNGKTSQGRFVGMVLVKAIIDVGGWECLRASEPWVRGLMSILQVFQPSLFAFMLRTGADISLRDLILSLRRSSVSAPWHGSSHFCKSIRHLFRRSLPRTCHRS
jgi:hypothetical protein